MSKRAWLVCVALLAAVPCRALWWGPQSESRWRDHPITVDGRDEDWKSQEPDEADGLAFAFANDDKDLYVLISPHTKSLKQQMAGDFGQDFTIWIDTSAGKKEKVAVKLLAPAGSADQTEREMASVGIDTDSVAAKDPAELRMGPMHERGVLEARIPLSYLGTPLPKTISLGLQTTALKKPPAGGRGQGRKSGMGGKHGASDSEEFEPIELWIRVTLSGRP